MQFKTRHLKGGINKTVTFRDRYESQIQPSSQEYDQFVAEFSAFAESEFTRPQIEWFNHAFGSGCGVVRVKNFDELSEEMKTQVQQLGLIEWFLKEFVDCNLKNEEPDRADML